MLREIVYRVVCSEERFTNVVYVDIALANGVTHEEMYYTRLQLHRNHSRMPLDDCGTRSVCLVVRGDNEPFIDFSNGGIGPRKSREYQAYVKLCDRLRPQIMETYEKMIASGRQSTFPYILSAPEVNVYKQQLEDENKAERESYKKKHQKKVESEENAYPKSTREERMMILNEQAKAQKQRHNRSMAFAKARDEKISPIMRMRINALLRSGD